MQRFATLVQLAVAIGLAGTAAGAQETVGGSGETNPDETSRTEPSLDELLEVEVSTATRLRQTTMRAPASVTVVTAEQIARFGWRTLAEVLSSVLGFYVTEDRNYTYLGTRGMSRPSDYNNRIQLLLDGYRLNEDVYGSAPAGGDFALDLRAVERIEVVRGPGSAAFGTAAMLAVVNVIPRSSDTTATGELALEAGSFERLGASARGVVRFPDGGGIAWSALATDVEGDDLYFSEYDDPATNDGRTRGTDFERSRGALAHLRLGELVATAWISSREKGIPTGAFEIDFDERRNATEDRWSLLGLRWEHPLARGWGVSARAVVGNYGYDGDYAYEGELFLDSSDNTWWGAEVETRWEQHASARLSAGLEHRDNRRADYRTFEGGVEGFYGDFPHRITSLWVQQEVQLTNRLQLNIGARHDRYSDGPDSTNPRLAVVYVPSPANSFKLLHGRAFRAPNVYETGYQVPGSAVSNPDLDPERIATTEVVWEHQAVGGVATSVAVYRSKLDDLIEQRLIEGEELLRFENVGNAIARGIELQLSITRPSGTMGYGGIAWQRTTDERTGAKLTNSPAVQIKLGLARPLRPDLQASGELLVESERLSLDGSSTGETVLASGQLAWSPAGRPWSLELRIRNLFDASYSHPGGLEHRQSSIEQNGRTILVRWGLRFQ